MSPQIPWRCTPLGRAPERKGKGKVHILFDVRFCNELGRKENMGRGFSPGTLDFPSPQNQFDPFDLICVNFS